MNKIKIGRVDESLFYILLGLFLILSLVPFPYLHHIKVFDFPLHYSIVGGGVFLLVILSWWQKDMRFIFFDKYLIVLFIGFSLSLIASIDRLNTFKTLISFFLRGLGVSFIAVRIVDSNKKREILIRVLLWGSSLVCLLGLVEFFMGYNPIFHRLYLSYSGLYKEILNFRSGMASTIGHPVALAAYLVLFFPLALRVGQNKKSLFAFIPFFLVVATIIFSFTRGAWIITTIMFILYFLKKEYRPSNIAFTRKIFKRILFGSAVFLIIIFSCFFFPRARQSFIDRVNFKIIKSDILYSHRAGSYRTTLNILRKFPFFGVGMGNYPLVHRLYRDSQTVDYLETPDNMYLRLLSETGIIGTLAFLLFIVSCLNRLLMSFRSASDFGWALTCGIIGFLLNLFTADLFYWLVPQFTFWLLLGVGVGYKYDLQREKDLFE